MELLHKIVCEIADREGVDPIDLEPPLNAVVDTNELEALSTNTEYRVNGPGQSMEFVYYGYSVSVDGSGNMCISKHSRTTDDGSREQSDSLQGSSSSETDHLEDALKKVTDIIAARERPFEQRLDGLLEEIRKSLRVESATLSYVENDSYVFEAVDTTPNVELQAGEIVPLANTTCKRVVQTEQTLVVRDIADEAPELADSALELSSYIGVPVFVDGDVYGTFCFFDTATREEEFSEWELTLVELLSNWVSSELAKRQRERSLHASTTERPYNRC